MRIRDDYDLSRADVNVQEFLENVRHILNFGLYDVQYTTSLLPTWKPKDNDRPILLMKQGAFGRLYIGDPNVTSGWWYVNLTELPA